MVLYPCNFQVFEIEVEKIEFLLGPGAERLASIRSGDNTHRSARSMIGLTAGVESC